MDSEKTGIRGENEMLNLHYSNNICTFAMAIFRRMS